MAEDGVGTSPHVFVVDSQANYVTMPNEKKSWQARAGQKFLLLLVALAVLALIIQGYLIYHLYQKTETTLHYTTLQAMSLAQYPSYCQNLSNPKAFALQGGSMSQVGSKEYTVHTQHRPFAHLVGSSNPSGQDNVVQWMQGGDYVILNMTYDKGRLIVEKEGYYYLYSKVQYTVDCSLIQHRVMKSTNAYDNPIELLKSKNYNARCSTPKHSGPKPADVGELLSSFLAGIFHLQKGDKIYVTLDNIHSIHPGTTENFMGAFMIFP